MATCQENTGIATRTLKEIISQTDLVSVCFEDKMIERNNKSN